MLKKIYFLSLLIIPYFLHGQVVYKNKVDTLNGNAISVFVDGNLDGNNSQKQLLYYSSGFTDGKKQPDFDPFDTLSIKNIDAVRTNNFTILSNNDNNYYTIDSICKKAIRPNCTTLNDTVYSIYDFVSNNHLYFCIPELFGSEPKDVTKFFGVYDYGHCGAISNCVVLIAERLTGKKGRWWLRLDGGHGWSEINIGDKWFFIDADEGQLLRDIDNKTYISYGDYKEDMYMGLRNKMFGNTLDVQFFNIQGFYIQLSHHIENCTKVFFNSTFTGMYNDSIGKFGEDLHYDLYPSEELKIINNVPNVFHHQNIPGYTTMPDSSTVLQNVRIAHLYMNVLDSNSTISTKLTNINNVSYTNKKLQCTDSIGSFVFSRKSTFPFAEIFLKMNANLSNSSDSIKVYFSKDSINWVLKKILTLQNANIDSALLSFAENNNNTACYNFYIKINIINNSGNCSIDTFVIQSNMQQSALITPSLVKGNNSIRINANTKLVSTIYWKESHNVNIPLPAISAIYPANNDTISNENIDFLWLIDSTALANNSLKEFYFQLSEFPDFKTTLCGQFNQYSFGNSTPEINIYKKSVYAHSNNWDIYNNNSRYYWRVKLKDSANTWSEWSNTWSFVAKVPMHPNSLHFELTNNDSTFKLTWTKNTDGIPTNITKVFGNTVPYISPYDDWSYTTVNDNNFVNIIRNTSLKDYNFRVAAYNNIAMSTPSRIVQLPKKIIGNYQTPINLSPIFDSLQIPFPNYPGFNRKYFPLFDSAFFIYDTSTKMLTPIKTGRSMLSICYFKNSNVDTIYKAQFDLEIKKTNIYVSVIDTIFNYGDSINFQLAYQNLPININVNSIFQPLPFVTDTNKIVGIYSYIITPGVLVDTNFIVNYSNGNFIINKSKLKVKPNIANSIYGDSIATITLNYFGFVYNENENVLSQLPIAIVNATPQSNVGNYIINVSNGMANNYYFDYDTSLYTITQKDLIIKPYNDTIIYGQYLNNFHFTYNGFVNGDTNTSLISQPIGITVANSSSPVGQYVINVQNANAVNYNIIYDSAFLTILKKDLFITVTSTNITYGDTPNFIINYVGFVNGESVQNLQNIPLLIYNVNNNSPIGNYPITLICNPQNNYNNILQQNIYCTIQPKSLIIKPATINSIYGTTPQLQDIIYTGFVNGDTNTSLQTQPILTTNATAASNVGNYIINVSGVSATNYSIVYDTATLTILPKELKVQPLLDTIVYGSSPSLTKLIYIGFVNGDTITNLTNGAQLQTLANNTSNVGTYTIHAYAANAINYYFVYDSSYLTIKPRALTIIPDSVYTIYGDSIILQNISYIGFVNGDTNTSLLTQPNLYTPANSLSSYGTYPIIAANATATNYEINYINGTLTIGHKTLLIKPSSVNSVYGSTPLLQDIIYTGFVNGDTNSSLQAQPILSTNATAASPVGNYVINVSGASATNYSIVYDTSTLTILPKELKVQPLLDTIVYGSSPNLTKLIYIGFVNGDTISNLISDAQLQVAANNTSNVGLYTIHSFGGSAQNYYFTYDSSYLYISPKPLTIIPNNVYTVYGDSIVLQNSTFVGFVNGDTNTILLTQPILTTTANSSSNYGTYPIIANNATAANYTINYINGTLTIGHKILTIKPKSVIVEYGTIPQLQDIIYTGFVNGDTNTSLQAQPILSTNATATSNVGNYVIDVSGASAQNYNIVYDTSILKITPKVLTIKPINEISEYGSLPSLQGYTSIGFVNGDTDINLLSQPIITTSANVLSSVGNYILTISNASALNYNIIYDTAVHTIIPKNLIIKPNAITSIYGNNIINNGISYIGFVNGDTNTNLLVQPIVQIQQSNISNVGTYPLYCSGGNSLNYSLQYDTSTLTINPKNLLITPINSTSIFGDSIIMQGVTYTGFTNGDSISSLQNLPNLYTSATSTSSVGSYPIITNAVSSINYSITYNPGIYTITKAPLQIIANANSKIYGDTNTNLTYYYQGFKNNNTESIFTTKPSLTTTLSTYSKAGNYPINFVDTTLTTTNYNLQFIPNIYEVKKSILKLLIKDTAMNYGDSLVEYLYEINGFKNNDNKDSLTFKPKITSNTTRTSLCGNYPIYFQGNPIDSNYIFKIIDGNLTILPIKPKLTIRTLSVDNNKIIFSINLENAGGQLNEIGTGWDNNNIDTILPNYKAKVDINDFQKNNTGTYTDTIYNTISGIYYIKAKVANNTSVTYSNLLIVNSLSASEVKLFPNPNDGNFTIWFPTNFIGEDAKIYNSLGEVVNSFIIKSESTKVSNKEKFSKGMYFIKVSNQSVTKFLIQ